MSSFPWINNLRQWWGARVPTVVDVPTGAEKPLTGTDAPKESSGFGVGGAATRSVENYSKSPPGNYATWRLMDQHSTLALAKVLVAGPILTGTRSVEVRLKPGQSRRKSPVTGDGVISDPLDKRAEFVNGAIDPIIFGLVRDCLDSLSMGHATFINEWKVQNGMLVVDNMRHLPPEEVELLVDGQKNFVGTQFGGQKYFGSNTFNYANDPKYRYWYGTPRHENCRAEWWEKMQAKVQGRALDLKAAGVTMVVKGPPGTGRTDENGRPVDGSQAAQNAANGIESLRTIWVPNYIVDPPEPSRVGDIEYMKAYAEVAKLNAFTFEQFDWGNTAAAALSLLAKCQYIDTELMRAWHRPEREATEGKHGNKAESETVGQIGITDSDLVHSDICAAISQGIINDLLIFNFGDDAANSVYLKAGPLIDSQIQRLLTVFLPLFQDKTVSEDFYRKLDKSEIFASLGLTPRGDVDVNEDPPAPVTPAVTPPAGDNPANGTGKLDPNDKAVMKLAASRFVWGED